MKENILVTGASGQVALELKDLSADATQFNWFFVSKNELDITDDQRLKEYIQTNKITTVVNCAAYTNVEQAETSIDDANCVNNFAVKRLGLVVKEFSLKLIHISTDAVFDGNSNTPYKENHKRNPLSVYSQTKCEGEKQLEALNLRNAMIIRTSWVYSSYGNNFVKTMLRLFSSKEHISVIDDQVGVPTYARDLAKTIIILLAQLECEELEIYHYSSAGEISWFQFAKEIALLTGSECEVKPISTVEYSSKVKRPPYSVLNTEKIKKTFGIEIPQWKDSLKECLKKLEVIE